MSTDYRARAALAQPEPEGPPQGGAIALLEQLRAGPDDHKDYEGYEDGWIDACNAAIDALLVAQPEPVGPTDEELWQIWHDVDGSIPTIFRAVLARFAHPTITPIPVSERPWEREGWCDAQGQCWMGDGGGAGFVPSWRLCKPSDSCLAWSLPAHALPAAPGEAKP